jgi:hypothetical protein
MLVRELELSRFKISSPFDAFHLFAATVVKKSMFVNNLRKCKNVIRTDHTLYRDPWRRAPISDAFTLYLPMAGIPAVLGCSLEGKRVVVW